MCHYITVVVRGADRAAVEGVLEKHGRQALPVANASVASVLAPGEAQFTTTGHCDCGTALARLDAELPEKQANARAAEAAKLARKGWSPTKIERWLADRTKADHKRAERGTFDSTDYWAAIVADLLATPGVTKAGLLLHFYNGSVDGEAFATTRVNVRVHDFETRLRSLAEDELVMASA